MQPLFLRAQQSQIPELFGDAAPGAEGIAGASDVPVGAPDVAEDGDQVIDPRVATLIRQALQAFAEAEEVLREGDLGTYQQRTRDAGELLEQAQSLTGDDARVLPDVSEPDESEDGHDEATGGGGVDEIEPSPGPELGQVGTGEDL